MYVGKPHIAYACKQMLHVDNLPAFCYSAEAEDYYKVLSNTASKLELLFFIGACHYIENGFKNRDTYTGVNAPIYRVVRYPETGPAISIIRSEWSMPNKESYAEIVIAPQVLSSEKAIHHDFVIYIPRTVVRPNARFQTLCAVEVDGYIMHRDRRDKDGRRDGGLTYPVLRLQEELEDPLRWFRYLDPGHKDCLWDIDHSMGVVYSKEGAFPCD